MRHIPEDELHAYLDQALSRSQCVEIERHLAECPRCQALRDRIAALRDRTTALLARIGPPTILPPPFARLEARHAERRRHRSRRLANAAWAASVAGAALLGWGLNRTPEPSRSTVSALLYSQSPAAPNTAVPSLQPGTASVVRQGSSAGRRTRPRLMRVDREDGPAPAQFGFAQAAETDPSVLHFSGSIESTPMGSAPLDYPDFSAQPVASDPQLAGLWRTVIPDSGATLRNSDIPLVPGLAVVHMRVQPGHGEEDVTAVDQVLESGEMIRTIAGPARRVGTLVGENAATEALASRSTSRVTVTIRQGDRMVAVTGPSEALGALLSRVSSKRRY